MRPDSISMEERLKAVKSWPPPVNEVDNITIAKLIYDAALEKTYWIYDPVNKEWIDPKTFIKTQGIISKGNEDYLKRLEIRDPKDGISAGFKRIEELKIKLEGLVERVTKYYQNK